MNSILKSCLYVAMLSLWSLSSFSAFAAVADKQADKQAEIKQQLLKLGTEKICDPESEMYCEAHTAFVQGTDAIVLLSVQPTAGLFVIFQQEKTGLWVHRETHSLLDYEEGIAESKLSKASQAYFNQAMTAYLESRQEKPKD